MDGKHPETGKAGDRRITRTRTAVTTLLVIIADIRDIVHCFKTSSYNLLSILMRYLIPRKPRAPLCFWC